MNKEDSHCHSRDQFTSKKAAAKQSFLQVLLKKCKLTFQRALQSICQVGVADSVN
jgi:hypothetical protein